MSDLGRSYTALEDQQAAWKLLQHGFLSHHHGLCRPMNGEREAAEMGKVRGPARARTETITENRRR